VLVDKKAQKLNLGIIHDQSRKIGELVHLLDNSPEVIPIIDGMSSARHIYLVGCRSSYPACIIGAIYLSRLAGRTTIPVLASQFSVQYGNSINMHDVGIFICQGSEDKDITTALQTAQYRGMSCIGLSNVNNQILAQTTNRFLALSWNPTQNYQEINSFCSQLVTFLYLALQMGDFPTNSMAQLPDLINNTISSVENQVHSLLSLITDRNSFRCIGYGITYPVALIAAMIINEYSNIHCVGLLPSELKHSPEAEITDEDPVIYFIAPGDNKYHIGSMVVTNMRGGIAIPISEYDPLLDQITPYKITLPQSGPHFYPLISLLPIQILASQLR
jgi:glucosamine--fructose-6-phosphate aminotransferase (isomerizing)